MNMTSTQSDEYLKNKQKQYLLDLKAIMDTPAGVRLFAHILKDMGLFDSVYTTNSLVYKNAALTDFARVLTENMDRIDMQILVKVKQHLLNERQEMEALNGRRSQ